MGRTARTRLITVGVLVVVFGAGVLIGFVADSELGASPTPPATVVADTADEAEQPGRRFMYHEVDPNEIQLERIDSVRQVHRERTKALYDELRAEYPDRFRAILLDTREAIKSVLTPEQAAEYQRLLDAYDEGQGRKAERENGDEKD